MLLAQRLGSESAVRPSMSLARSPSPIANHSHRDRATYDPTSSSAVNYYVADPADAPANLTYGPSFFDLASKLNGPTTIGLNRRLNNINNTIAAAEQAVKTMDNLYAIELGNEPDCGSSLSASER